MTDDPLGFDTRVKVASDRNTITIGTRALEKKAGRKPDGAPPRWAGLIGEYGWDHNTLYIFEKDGRLFALIEWFFLDQLTEDETKPDVFRFPDRGLYEGESLRFTRDALGRATRVEAANVVFERRAIDGEDGMTFQIKPVRPVAELRAEALSASPPAEHGDFRAPDLVDLTTLDPTIVLEIRYATENNFLRHPGLHLVAGVPPAPGGGGPPACPPIAQGEGARPPDPRCVSPLVRDPDLLGRDPRVGQRIRRQSVEGLAA